MEFDSGFRCELVAGAPSLVVAFFGELDAAASDAAWAEIAALLDDNTEGLVIDLSGLTFIDSRGLSVLIRAWRALGAVDGRRVTLRGPKESIRRTLEVAGVAQAFEII